MEALNCSQNAPKRPEGQLASIRLVTGPTETQIGIGGARNSQECGLRPILGRHQEPRDMLRALKKDLEQILKPQNFQISIPPPRERERLTMKNSKLYTWLSTGSPAAVLRLI